MTGLVVLLTLSLPTDFRTRHNHSHARHVYSRSNCLLCTRRLQIELGFSCLYHKRHYLHQCSTVSQGTCICVALDSLHSLARPCRRHKSQNRHISATRECIDSHRQRDMETVLRNRSSSRLRRICHYSRPCHRT